MQFTTSQEVQDLGLKTHCITVTGLKNTKNNPDFDDYKNKVIEDLKSKYSKETIKTDPVLEGFRTLHTKVERSNRKYVSSPENLIAMLTKRGSIPSINLLVDIYNLVSIETRLAFGAHDINKIEGNVTLRLTKGDEKFLGLGQSEQKNINAGEYGYIDDSNEIICRLEYRQCEKTKVGLEVQDVFFIIQGNEFTSDEYIENATKKLIDLVKQYCGGNETIL